MPFQSGVLLTSDGDPQVNVIRPQTAAVQLSMDYPGYVLVGLPVLLNEVARVIHGLLVGIEVLLDGGDGVGHVLMH